MKKISIGVIKIYSSIALSPFWIEKTDLHPYMFDQFRFLLEINSSN